MSSLQHGLEQILRFGYYDASVLLKLTDAVIEANNSGTVQFIEMEPYECVTLT